MGGFFAGAAEVVRVMNLPCREHSMLISHDTDGQLPRATRVGLHLHFILCSPCRHFAAQLRFLGRAAARLGVVGAERSLEGGRMPPEVRDRLRRRLRSSL
jgi:hypothetical protein